jgi:hypothetical protein
MARAETAVVVAAAGRPPRARGSDRCAEIVEVARGCDVLIHITREPGHQTSISSVS